MRIYTIGYRSRSAEEFFSTLRENGIRQLVDVRAYPDAEEAVYARASGLPFLLQQRAPQTRYWHCGPLSPTTRLVDDYFAENRIGWQAYEEGYVRLIQERKVESVLKPEQFAEPACLLCAEHDPERCQRRLALEYLKDHWPDLEIVHL
ncbi:MAG TPA: DUF488 domain-containing protein [Bdellovibrionota bacterium]|nr:DUF488 domain-containing protein [Bdellovibrionota bacterium]